MSFNFIKDNHKSIHFIGIGGVSMSGIAEILINKGYTVSGSDRNSSKSTEKLSKLGATIFIGHEASNVIKSDLVVYTAAIAEDNPELKKAKELNIELMDRAEFLGKIMNGHKYNIGVAGTHGKTTTTSMLSHIILKAQLDPTILVGGSLDIIDGNVRVGESEYFITEACEYKASFLKFPPYLGIILNIEEDHLDYYKDIHHIEDTFLEFTKLIPNDGFVILNADDPRCLNLQNKYICNTKTFGIKNGDLKAKNIVYSNNGCPSFDVTENEKKLFHISLNVPGNHNISNSLASIAAALCLAIEHKYIVEGIESFYGTHRRFEIKGSTQGVTVIDDYAHHPTEIKATLEASRNFPHNKIVCVFQPHTYSRTKSLFKEFSQCFTLANKVILADIYAAREPLDESVSSLMLAEEISQNGVDCVNFHSFEEILQNLKKTLEEGDLLLTVGAGDVYLIGEMLLEQNS
ncbi:UDP-N-acetylmuramate--L-alanine ligase [Clostridium grantii]|uniref:UDP-N-acetylmuramate--L-alanine ligase n=1 Tax=Clostridium grantii DSM 8605 TaxID=1121316 RepID=A0A1M5X8V3_9CLOT|nr:UDP-N-acetylmuramate--L-alanine ligase [Clostridium grantii]SHH96211.1 UDP-N-acetylmuramate--L-alanine ligase [Clostridium grantii DSM 8605]